MKAENLEIGKPKDTAAGMPSAINGLRYALKESGAAKSAKLLLRLNQKDGIDCQSCAWADPDKRTIAEFCENGIKALSDEATSKRIGPDFFARHSISGLREKSGHWLNSQGRITHPMFLPEGAAHYQPLSWENAFKIIAEELNALASPDEAIFYTSGRTSNEAAFLYQLFVRQFGTNNLPDCSNMCHESTSVALAESIGLGKATVRLEDLEDTDLILIIGQNPGTNAPRMMSSLRKAKERGAKIIAINPLPEAGLMNFIDPNPQHYENPLKYPLAMLGGKPTAFADLHLPIRIGGDMALLKGMMKIILERENSSGGILDHKFIEAYTSGFEGLKAGLESIGWDEILECSGLNKEEIEKAAEIFMASGRVISCWAMGVTQHTSAVATIQDIVNLHLLRGQIGKQGAGLLPVRGHSNVQGDRTMGIWEKMNPVFRQNLEKEFSFKPPDKDGLNTIEAIGAMRRGEAKVFFAMGGNFLSAAPDTEYTEKALGNSSLTVQVVTKLNRTALAPGKRSLILPCLGRSEKDMQESGPQFVSTESTMLNVQRSEGILDPVSPELRSEVWIVCELAKATLGEKATLDWGEMAANYDNIRELISRVVPGFEEYNERIRIPGGFYLPNPPMKRAFPTSDGKAQFKSSALAKTLLKPGELMLTTIRSHDQFNTAVYDNNDRYRGIKGSRKVVFMNSRDMAERNLENGSLIDIQSCYDGVLRKIEAFAAVEYPIPEKCCAAYFPEANPLIPVTNFAERSFTPTSKLTIVKIKKSAS